MCVCVCVCLSHRDAYKGGLSAEEMAELEELANEKSAGMSLLVERDNEIRGIRDGTITSSKVSQHNTELSLCRTLTVIKLRPPLERGGAPSEGPGEGVAGGAVSPSPSAPPASNQHSTGG